MISDLYQVYTFQIYDKYLKFTADLIYVSSMLRRSHLHLTYLVPPDYRV